MSFNISEGSAYSLTYKVTEILYTIRTVASQSKLKEGYYMILESNQGNSLYLFRNALDKYRI